MKLNRQLAAWGRITLLASACAATSFAQPAPQQPLPDVSKTSAGAPHRTRLILKDGSYQIVMSYQIKGKIVSYVSAERGEVEELPADLVDWDATHKWEKQHPPADESDAAQQQARNRQNVELVVAVVHVVMDSVACYIDRRSTGHCAPSIKVQTFLICSNVTRELSAARLAPLLAGICDGRLVA